MIRLRERRRILVPYDANVGLISGSKLLCCVLVLAVIIGLVGMARFRLQNRRRR